MSSEPDKLEHLRFLAEVSTNLLALMQENQQKEAEQRQKMLENRKMEKEKQQARRQKLQRSLKDKERNMVHHLAILDRPER